MAIDPRSDPGQRPARQREGLRPLRQELIKPLRAKAIAKAGQSDRKGASLAPQVGLKQAVQVRDGSALLRVLRVPPPQGLTKALSVGLKLRVVDTVGLMLGLKGIDNALAGRPGVAPARITTPSLRRVHEIAPRRLKVRQKAPPRLNRQMKAHLAEGQTGQETTAKGRARPVRQELTQPRAKLIPTDAAKVPSAGLTEAGLRGPDVARPVHEAAAVLPTEALPH